MFLGFLTFNDLGLYSKAPDAEFEGSTSLVIRSWNEPFFNSEERFCISTNSEDNPVCPEVASAYREKYSVLIDFPWWQFAHDMSLKNLSDRNLSLSENQSK